MIPALVVLVLVVYGWRRMRQARQRQASAVAASPVVQALNGVPVRPRSRGLRGSRGAM
jgi:hypothetical protein